MVFSILTYYLINGDKENFCQLYLISLHNSTANSLLVRRPCVRTSNPRYFVVDFRKFCFSIPSQRGILCYSMPFYLKIGNIYLHTMYCIVCGYISTKELFLKAIISRVK